MVDHVARLLSSSGYDVAHRTVRELPPAELLSGHTENPVLRRALDEVAAADALIVATPVYKASYTGLLKAFLDLLPQSGLAGKTVLPLATGGSLAHVLAIDYALRPVLTALGARHVVPGCFLVDRTIERLDGDAVRLEPDTEWRLLQALDVFRDALPAGTPLVTAAR